MNDNLCSAIYCMVAAYAFWSLVSVWYRDIRTTGKMILAVGVGTTIFAGTLFGVLTEGWVIAIELILAFLLVKDGLVEKIVNLSLMILLVAILSDMSQIIVLMFIDNNNPITRVFSIGLTFLLLLIGYYTKAIQKILCFSEGMRLWKKLVCLLTMIIVMLVVSFGIVMLGMTDKVSLIRLFLGLAFLMLLAFSTLLFMFLFEMYYHKSFQRESEIKENVIHEQKAIYDLLVNRNEDLRKFRHDLRNHLGTLQIVLEKGNIREASEYLNDIVEENNKLSMKQYYYGNTVLDTIISMMCLRAKEANVDISVTGELEINPDFLYELCGVFSNAMSNAIEACVARNSSGPVEVIAKSGGAMQIIMFRNPATEEMYRNVSNQRSSKTDKENHGIGIRSMCESVSKMNGTISYEFQDNIILLIISIGREKAIRDKNDHFTT